MTEAVIKAIQEQLIRHFTRFDANALRGLLEIAGHPTPGTARRDEAVFWLIEQMSSKAAMRKLWDRLDATTQQALSLTVHVTNSAYQPETVLLRYGFAPPPPLHYWSGYRPSPLDLFLDEDQSILSELVSILRVVVPKPEPWQIPTQHEPPPRYESFGFERSPGVEVSLQDLTAVLALIGQGRIFVSDRMLPTIESIQLILENLSRGDFFALAPGQSLEESIRPVGLVRFLLGADMATLGPRSGFSYVLQLKPFAWEWLERPNADLLLDAVERWSANTQYDELDRLTHLRGADRPGSTRTPPSGRRDRIIEALSWCPHSVWLSADDFFKAIKLWQFDFDVDRGDEVMAISDSTGRKLSVTELREPWKAVQGGYVLVVLWEILASLGAIDLAYTEPQHAPPLLETPTESWQRPIHPFSRYDGMTYFRINALGAYLFGHTKGFALPKNVIAPFFHIDERYTFQPTQEALLPYQNQLLPLIGTIDPASGRYRLGKANWLNAQHHEGTMSERRQLLLARHEGPLAPAVEDWLEQCEADSTALRKGRMMITIQVRRPDVRNVILDDPELRRYCRLLDDQTLIIPSSREHAFLRRVLELGYGMAGGNNKDR